MALAPLTYLSTHFIKPSIIITNDWPCGLVATYCHMYYESTSLATASFFHIIHNLDDSYEGRIYPSNGDTLENIHHIPLQLLQDPYWEANILNPSRCVLLSTDNWGTVSNTYQHDIENGSALSPLLRRFPQPFSGKGTREIPQRRTRISKRKRLTETYCKISVSLRYFTAWLV